MHHSDKSEAQLTVIVPSAEFVPYLDKAARKISERTKIAGFRPGKAPASVIAQHVGQDALLHEAMDMALPRFFTKAIIEHKLEAIGHPRIAIKKLAPESDFEFEATVSLMPKVTLPDLTTLTASSRPVEITDQEVDQELSYLAKMRSTFLEVARPAQVGDTLTVDFSVKIDNATIEGGEKKNQPIHLGEGHFLPEFEQKIQGMSAGEERTFNITLTKETDVKKEDQGKIADVWVKAHSVQKRIIPSLDDEFARQLGKFKDLAHLKEELKKGMKHEKEHKEGERVQGELSEQLAKKSTFTAIPEVLINKEIERRLDELKQLLSLQGKKIEDYLQEKKKTLVQVQQELRPAAELAVKINLALRELIRSQNIEATQEETNEKLEAYLQRFGSAKQAQEKLKPEELKENIAANLRYQKALEHLQKSAKITSEIKKGDKKK